MMIPFDYAPGVIFDGRSALLSIAGLFGGPITAAIAAAIASVYRLWIGGSGALTGVGVIITSAALGIGLYYKSKKQPHQVTAWQLYALGVVVHVSMLLWMFSLPWPLALGVLSKVSLPVMVIFPLATLLLGSLLSDMERRYEAQQQLRGSWEQYQAIVDTQTELVDRWLPDGTLLFVNAAYCRYYGKTEEELVGSNWLTCVVDEERDEMEEHVQRLRISLAPDAPIQTSEHREVMAEGEIRWTRWIDHGIFDEKGALEEIQSTGQDITERHQATVALQQAHQKIERLHQIARQLETCESEDDIYRITVAAAEKILSFSMYTLNIVEGQKLLIRATSSELPTGASQESNLEGGGLAAETYRTGKTTVFGSVDEVPQATPSRGDFRSGISAPIGDVGVFQVASTEESAFTTEDVSLLELLLGHTTEAIHRIRLQERLREQALHDPLTGVYNRRYFSQAIEQEITRSQRYDHPIGFLMIDVNHFKEINDRYGHQVGDEVLQEVAKLLQGQVRESDLVVRYGGDEFLLLLIETKGETEKVKQRILEQVARWSKANPVFDFSVTLAIGGADWFPEDSQPVEEILAEADKRMYEEKRR